MSLNLDKPLWGSSDKVMSSNIESMSFVGCTLYDIKPAVGFAFNPPKQENLLLYPKYLELLNY
jgi:hypothetical protein